MAGRPRTEIGTYGTIKVREVKPGVHEARTRFRMRNGRLKDVIRRGPTGPAAERKLKKALAEMADDVAGKNINGGTRMSRVMALWLAEFEEDVALGKRAHTSLYDYRSAIKALTPLMGDLTCKEAENAGIVHENLKDLRRSAASTARSKNGEAAMLRARTVLSNVCTYAVMHGAMTVNPVKSLKRIDREQEPVRALEPDERGDFRAKFRAEAERRAGAGKRVGKRAQIWSDLPELVDAMLSTGFRLGEALALTPEDVDLEGRQVCAGHHLVRVAGVGIVRQPKRKGNRQAVQAGLTSWTESMWRRRVMAAAPGGPLFPTWNGSWLDVSNVTKKIAEVCEQIGYGWVSSRYFRHTTATHLGDSDLTDNAISDALGNTPDVVRKHYRRKRASNPAVAAALESMLDQ